MCAQFIIGFLDPSSFVSYNIIAVFFCLCLFPLTLTSRVIPEIPKAPRLRPLSSFRLSPLAFSAVIVAGLTGSSIRMVAPIYGDAIVMNSVGITGLLPKAIISMYLSFFPVVE